ncbi:MAG: hypothetical protein H7Z71_07890 [Moraxellaceae bacterium]|nr:hypothetical protein [Pseudobdellovibrionaceae bacterium]
MKNLTQKQYTQSDKILMSVCLIATGILVYGLVHFKTSSVKLAKSDAAQINYEMAKLQNPESLYSLENREIEVDYKALQIKKAAAQKNDLKKVTDKTKKAITPAAQASLQNAIAQKASASRKTPPPLSRSKASVESARDQSTTSKPSEKLNSNPIQDQLKVVDNALPVDAAVNAKKSFEAWKSEIFAAQNKEVIIKLVAALKKGEVSSEDYQKLVSEMINSKDDKIVGLALYALRSVPSYSSYVQLVKLEGNVSSNYSVYLEQSLMAYNQTANLSVLKQSLVGKDKQVVLRTLTLIKSGVTSVKSGEVSGLVDPRNVRDTVNQLSLTNYLTFLPVLIQLAGSPDQDIVNLANQNITLIDDPQYVASN